MAKKSTTNKQEVTEMAVEETVVPVEAAEEVKVEVTEAKEAVAEPVVAKARTIIAKAPTAFRKTTSLEIKQIVGQMPIGVAYEIVKECSSKIYGDFYKLSNGYYITKNGNYEIN